MDDRSDIARRMEAIGLASGEDNNPGCRRIPGSPVGGSTRLGSSSSADAEPRDRRVFSWQNPSIRLSFETFPSRRFTITSARVTYQA